MKLTSVTRCTLALVEAIHIARRSATRNLRSFRKEFAFTTTKRHWAVRFYKEYLDAKIMSTRQGEVLRDHFGRMVRTITLIKRYNGMGVAA